MAFRVSFFCVCVFCSAGSDTPLWVCVFSFCKSMFSYGSVKFSIWKLNSTVCMKYKQLRCKVQRDHSIEKQVQIKWVFSCVCLCAVLLSMCSLCSLKNDRGLAKLIFCFWLRRINVPIFNLRAYWNDGILK